MVRLLIESKTSKNEIGESDKNEVNTILDPGKWWVFGRVVIAVFIVVINVEVSAAVIVISQVMFIWVKDAPGQFYWRGVYRGRYYYEHKWLSYVPPGGHHWLLTRIEISTKICRIYQILTPTVPGVSAVAQHRVINWAWWNYWNGIVDKIVDGLRSVKQFVYQLPYSAAKGYKCDEEEYDQSGHVEVEQTVVVLLASDGAGNAQYAHDDCS